MAITPLSTQPNSVTRPSTFNADSDTYHTELTTFITEANALGTSANADATTATTQAGIATTKAGLTAADRVQTGLDAVATAADRVQTGLDRTAADASAASAAAIAGAFVGTSATSWTPTIGAQTFATQTGEQYTAGVWINLVSAAAPTAWGFGQVTSYTGSTLVMDIQVIAGTGAHTDWNISLVGARGPAGPMFSGTLAQLNAAVSDADVAQLGANTFTGAQTLGNNNLLTIKTASFNGQVASTTTTGAVTINWTTGQNFLQTEPTGAITYTFTAPPGVCHLQLIINSDGTSTAQTITWPATVKWVGATWAGVNNKIAVINFWYDGTSYFAQGGNQV